MNKQFNITGLCIPDIHWTADVPGKLQQIIKMVEAGDYFIINRPRQFGKTTILFMLEKELLKTGSFLPIEISFEGIDAPTFNSHPLFIQTFLGKISKELKRLNRPDLLSIIQQETGAIQNFFHLDELLEKLNTTDPHLVLMIDEVDNSSNNQLFLDFLGMLRNKYLERHKGKGATFHSVILAGVHDIKTLKYKIRPNEDQKFNSPWNIAANFDVPMELDVTEISSLLTTYSLGTGVTINIPAYVEKLYYYTSGHPFLVSYLCKLLDEKIMPGKSVKRWDLADIEVAVTLLLKETNSNFDSLIKNLENNPELYTFIKSIAIEGDSTSYHVTDNLISLAKMHGMVAEEEGNCKIHNKIYEQLIYDHMMVKLIREGRVEKISQYTISANYIDSDGNLDFEKVLLKFQEFMKEQYSQKDRSFLERNGRLVFQAFLKPIINGKGFDFKEAQISAERRLDIAVTWGNTKYIIELKIWRGPKAHKEGLQQLTGYLEHSHSPKGYLIIFDTGKRKRNQWSKETIHIQNKEIFMVRV